MPTISCTPFRSHAHRWRSAIPRLTAATAVLVLSAACSDSPTVPQRSSGADVFSIRPEEASVVLHRTLETPDGPNGAVVVKRQTLVQQLRTVAHNEESHSSRNIVRLGDSSSMRVTSRPIPILSAPAQLRSSACANAQRWTRTVPVDAMPGAVAVATGQGDAPATRVQILRNGQPIAEVTRSWVRMPRSWELTRQEVHVPSRHYRDVVEIERRPAAGNVLPVPIPVFACLARDSVATVRAEQQLDPFGGYGTLQLPSALEAPMGPRQLDSCVADGYDNCQGKRDLKMAADLAYVTTSVLVAVECPTLVLVKTSACIKAISQLSAAIAASLATYHALEQCIAEQEAKQKACECAGGVAMEAKLDDAGMTPRAHAWIAPGTGKSYMDCGGVNGSGGDSSPVTYHDSYSTMTPEDTGAGGVYVCEYEVDYNAETDTITIYPLYCYVQWLQ